MVMTRSQMLAEALRNNSTYNMGQNFLQQGMRQANSPGAALGNALTTYAGLLATNKAKKEANTQADTQSKQLADLLMNSGFNVPQGVDPGMAMPVIQAKANMDLAKQGQQFAQDRFKYQQGMDAQNFALQQAKMNQDANQFNQTIGLQRAKLDKPENPFGNNSTGNLLNVLNTYPPESNEYKIAYAAYSQPKTSVDQSTGQMVSITPDMSAFRPPSGMGGDPNIQQAGGMPGAGGATVQSVAPPKAPTGFRYKEDGTLEPIPGGPQAQEVKDIEQSRLEGIAGTERMIRTIDSLLTHPGREAATGMSYMLSSIPGTEAKNFASTLETLKSQAFLPMVQSLKGMGQLSNAEGEKLTAAIGALDPAMTEEAFVQSLNTIKADFQNALSRMRGSGGDQFNPVGQPTAQQSGLSDGPTRDEILQEMRRRGLSAPN